MQGGLLHTYQSSISNENFVQFHCFLVCICMPYLDNPEKSFSVLVIHQPVIEDTVHFVDPETADFLCTLHPLGHHFGLQQQDALRHRHDLCQYHIL